MSVRALRSCTGLLTAALAWGLVIAVSAALTYFAMRDLKRGLAIAGMGLVASVVATRVGARSDEVRWIPIGWVALLLVSDHRFDLSGRSPLDAAYGNASIENIVQVAVYAVIGAFVVRSRHQVIQRDGSKIPKLPIVLFPSFALISVLWSPIPVFTLVRAMQLLIAVSLALLTVRVWRSSPEEGRAIWRKSLSLFVQVVTVLALIGLVVRNWPDNRFSWPGVSPGAASLYLGVALLILLVGGRAFAPPPASAYWFRIGLLVTTVFLGRTRGVLASLALAGLIALWALGKERPIARYLGVWYYGIATLLILVFARVEVTAYLSRGESGEVFTTLNGRIPLWELAIQELSEAGRWIAGFGYGAARILLYPKVSWAGTAHNAWIEVLMGVGVIGAVLLVADVLFLLWRLGYVDSSLESRVALVLLTFHLVGSITTEAIVVPGIGFVTFALLQVPALARYEPSTVHVPSYGLAPRRGLMRGPSWRRSAVDPRIGSDLRGT